MKKKNDETVIIRSQIDFAKAYDIISRGESGIHVRMDLYLSELHPMDILIITQFAIWLQSTGGEITLSVEEHIRTYVEDIGLSEFCNSNVHSPATIDSISSQTAMPIRRVDRETMYAYVDATEAYMKNICLGKDLQMLNHCLSELINNVYDHSNSKIDAYVFCEYYPLFNIIRVAVSDLGIVIPNSVKNYLKRENKIELGEKECVKWALEENRTVKSSPHNMGKGLDNLNSFARANDTVWKIVTNGILMKGEPSKNSYYDNPIVGFQGTIVELDIRVDNLHEHKLVDDDWEWAN